MAKGDRQRVILRLGEKIVYTGDNLDRAIQFMRPPDRQDMKNHYEIIRIEADSSGWGTIITQQCKVGMREDIDYGLENSARVRLNDLKDLLKNVT